MYSLILVITLLANRHRARMYAEKGQYVSAVPTCVGPQ